MVYNSVILFDTGVPVANVIPLPPVISSIYRHFINISELFCASVCEMPATFLIFVYKKRFLNAWLSSTKSLSMPSCSNVTTSSFLVWSFNLSSFAFSVFFVFSICLTVYCCPTSSFAVSIDTVISAI